MPAQRATGQDSQLSLLIGAQSFSSLAITSAEMTWQIEIKEAAILGDKYTRVDEQYKNVAGTFDWQIASKEDFEILAQLVGRAQRRRPPRPIATLKTQITLPADGTRVLLIAQDMSFGNIPLRMPSQDEHISLSVQWACALAGIVFH